MSSIDGTGLKRGPDVSNLPNILIYMARFVEMSTTATAS